MSLFFLSEKELRHCTGFDYCFCVEKLLYMVLRWTKFELFSLKLGKKINISAYYLKQTNMRQKYSTIHHFAFRNFVPLWPRSFKSVNMWRAMCKAYSVWLSFLQGKYDSWTCGSSEADHSQETMIYHCGEYSTAHGLYSWPDRKNFIKRNVFLWKTR